jgi:hypothetical protein
MSTCVEIEIEDDGTVMVGVKPQEQETPGEEAQDKQYLQPANSVDEALTTAKDLLTNPQVQQAEKQGGFDDVFKQGAPGPADQQGA